MFDAPTMQIIPSTRLCRVHLFRHGEVVGGRGRTCRGHGDVPLSELGQAQTALLARWARTNLPPPDHVYSSDLSRCTALGRALHPAPEELPGLREQHMGAWDGRTWEDLTREDPAGTSAWWGDYVHARAPGGESFGELYDRVGTWWESEPREGRIFLVTHIGVIRALVCRWLGLGPGEGLRWAPGYATHTQILLAEAGAVIERFGEHPTAELG